MKHMNSNTVKSHTFRSVTGNAHEVLIKLGIKYQPVTIKHSIYHTELASAGTVINTAPEPFWSS